VVPSVAGCMGSGLPARPVRSESVRTVFAGNSCAIGDCVLSHHTAGQAVESGLVIGGHDLVRRYDAMCDGLPGNVVGSPGGCCGTRDVGRGKGAL
jgi:hypothetical protein